MTRWSCGHPGHVLHVLPYAPPVYVAVCVDCPLIGPWTTAAGRALPSPAVRLTTIDAPVRKRPGVEVKVVGGAC